MGRVRMEMTPVTRAGRMKRMRADMKAPRPEDFVAGAVYALDRDFGLTPTAVYTGEQTATGRMRFEVVDRQIGESRYFSVKPDAVVGKVAESLAEWCKRGERMVGMGGMGKQEEGAA